MLSTRKAAHKAAAAANEAAAERHAATVLPIIREIKPSSDPKWPGVQKIDSLFVSSDLP